MAHTPPIERLAAGMDSGVLSFPLTPFDSSGAVNLDAFRAHVAGQLDAAPGALFACCGTGEFFSLSEPEYAELVAAAVAEAGGRVPIVAGAGYAWPQAARFAAAAEHAGADALLLMPPYLVSAPAQGLVQHVREVVNRTSLPVIVYQRAQVKLSLAAVAELAEIEQVIGIKDGHGDLDQVQRIKIAAPARWLFFNGVATAEMQARQYGSIGVHAYSSAVHAFAPEIAKTFFQALRAGHTETIETLLREFYVPLVELRDQGTGYAVSLVKAAAGLRDPTVGPVRAPLAPPAPEHVEAVSTLLDHGLAVASRVEGRVA